MPQVFVNRRVVLFGVLLATVLAIIYLSRQPGSHASSAVDSSAIEFGADEEVDMNGLNDVAFREVNSTDDMEAIFRDLWSEIFEVSEHQRKMPPSVLIKTMKFIIQEVDEYDPALVKFVRSLIYRQAPRGQIQLHDKQRADWDFSQYGQAKIVDKILGQMRNGFFIEAGALDGESHSNTIFLELQRNWTGLLIEPVPLSFEALLAKRRHVFAINCCIAEKRPIIAKFRVFAALSGRLSELSDQHKKRIDSESKSKNENDEQIVYVPCFSLNTILKAIGVKRVDFFSLDVEGGEWPVVKSIDYKAIDIRSFVIEWPVHPKTKKPMIDHLEKQGFKLVKEDAQDIFLYKTTS